MASIAGGSAAVLDALLNRKSYSAGLVDHAGHTLVVMSRPTDRASRPREYRLLHTRSPRGTDALVATLGKDGFRLVTTALDGGVFHAAFARATDGPPVEYRVFANRGRTSWMSQIQQDPEAGSRLIRVAPMGLDHALVELGPPTAPAGALEWISSSAFRFTGQKSALQAKTAAGFHVQTVRVRGNEIDALLVKPAGWSGTPAVYDLDEGRGGCRARAARSWARTSSLTAKRTARPRTRRPAL